MLVVVNQQSKQNMKKVRQPLKAFVAKNESRKTELAIRHLLLNKEFCIQVGQIRGELGFYKIQLPEKEEYKVNKLIGDFRIYFNNLSYKKQDWHHERVEQLRIYFGLPISWRRTLYYFVSCGWAAEPQKIKISSDDQSITITVKEGMSFNELVNELRSTHREALTEALQNLPKMRAIKHTDQRKVRYKHVEADLDEVIHISREWNDMKAEKIASDLVDSVSLNSSEVRAIASRYKNATKK